MLELLNFFEGEDGSTGGGLFSNLKDQWWLLLIFGVLIVGMILMMIIPQRRQKKRAEEMMANLVVGSIVTTIGGIVGEVVQIDDKHVWLATGTEENRTIMQFVRQAVHSVAPAPGSPEAVAEAKAEQEKENEVDEVK